MSIKLSNAMQHMLKAAPDYWSKAPASPSVDALRRRGLVEFRSTPGETGMLAGFQWRITDTGREVDGRGDAPTYDVTVWNDATGDVVKTLYDASDDEVDEVRERYEDEPFHTVVVEERL
jgi:hypothetical protein